MWASNRSKMKEVGDVKISVDPHHPDSSLGDVWRSLAEIPPQLEYNIGSWNLFGIFRGSSCSETCCLLEVQSQDRLPRTKYEV